MYLKEQTLYRVWLGVFIFGHEYTIRVEVHAVLRDEQHDTK